MRGADAVAERCSTEAIQVMTAWGGAVAPAVWGIPDPPAVLYARGNLECVAMGLAVAIVGTREPTPYGQGVSRRFAQRCAERSVCVVSGLAIGCDSLAHEGCLDAHGRTVAVLAHGLDTVYPLSSRSLAARILDEGGMLVSEYPPGVGMRPNQLVERDRLQPGLSGGLIVIETDIKGGTMHAVRQAREQKRPVACLQHPAHLLKEAKAQGNQSLILRGDAVPLASGDDLGAFLDGLPRVDASSPNTQSSPIQLDLFHAKP